LTSAQLPELTQTRVDGIKLYPDKPLLQDKKTGAGITGIRQQKIALIPTAAGIYTLPEVTLPWWNVVTGKQEKAHIPARTIEVKAGPNINKAIASLPSTTETVTSMTPATERVETNHFWIWLSLVLATGWAASMSIWWYGRHKAASSNPVEEDDVRTIRQRDAMKRLTLSCTRNNARDAREALLVWANSLGDCPSFVNLNQLGQYFGEQLKIQIGELNQSLYGENAKGWKGDELLRSCESIASYKKTSRADSNASNLCPLNP
jgi:hypothetical protein